MTQQEKGGQHSRIFHGAKCIQGLFRETWGFALTLVIPCFRNLTSEKLSLGNNPQMWQKRPAQRCHGVIEDSEACPRVKCSSVGSLCPEITCLCSDLSFKALLGMGDGGASDVFTHSRCAAHHASFCFFPSLPSRTERSRHGPD